MISKNILKNIQKYVDAAEDKHGDMNPGILYGPACIAEEAGEALREALGIVEDAYTEKRMTELKKEVYQTIAVAIRFLEVQE